VLRTMMIYPPITELVDKTGSRYSLVIETAKRARQLVSGAQALSNVKTTKEVTVAVNEIYEGKVEIVEAAAVKKEAVPDVAFVDDAGVDAE